MPLKTEISKLWVKLSGNPSEFHLDARIFHSLCLISIAALSYNIPFNYIIGLPKVATASVIAFLVSFALYYMSRFKHKTTQSILIFNFFGLTLFTGLYFLNSGVDGPTNLFFLLFLLLSIAINPINQYKIWIPINITLMLVLQVLEYYFPNLVPNTYENRFSEFVDQTSAYIVVAIMTYFCAAYIRRNYEREKKSALEKSKFIELKNLQILSQNRELEKLNTEKNKLLSIIAHDVRSPLANIQNYLEMLNEYDLESEQKTELENSLLNSTKDTLNMLSKLLAWSKSQLHGITAYPENLNLNQLLQETLNSEKSIADQKGIDLDYHFDPSLAIYADKDMMQLIVRNFIGNAIKFTPQGGNIKVSAQKTDDDCVIIIQDTGIGISPERQDVIFSLKAQSTYGTRGEKGVGLGLLLCIEYITAQKGKIWFDSIPEKGTCFYISIPLNQSQKLLIA